MKNYSLTRSSLLLGRRTSLALVTVILFAAVLPDLAQAVTPWKKRPFAKRDRTTSSATDRKTSGERLGLGKKKLTVRTTAYTHTERDHRCYGRKNAIGTTLKYGKTRSAAADWSIFPLGTKFRISGDPSLYVIDDYGSALVGKRTIDLYKPSRGSMNSWGVRHVEIHVLEWGSNEKSAKLLRERRGYRHCREMLRCLEAKI